MRCKFSPIIFLHGEVISFDANTRIYIVHINWEDNENTQYCMEDELEKIISKLVVGIGGNAFVPYTEMPALHIEGRVKLVPTIYMYLKVMQYLGLLSVFVCPTIISGP